MSAAGVMPGPAPAADAAHWVEANQRHLFAAIAVIRCELERGGAASSELPAAQRALAEAEAAMPAPATLAALREAFGLSPFEYQLLVLCAGCELDPALGELCREARGGRGAPRPNFQLAAAALEGAHWSALSPGRPLRRFRLLELGEGETLADSVLRIDERVLHFLLGVADPDARLDGLIEPVEPALELSASHRALADQMAAAWTSAARGERLPVIELCGSDGVSKRAVAAAACAQLGLRLHAVHAHLLGSGLDEALIALLLSREVRLSASAVLVDCDELEPAESAAAQSRRLIDRVLGPLIVSRRERGQRPRRAFLALDVPRPSSSEQRALYRSASAQWPEHTQVFSERAIEQAAEQFDLSARSIQAACALAARQATGGAQHALWDACRLQGRARLDELAQRIEPIASWEDLVLPAQQRGLLQDIAARVRQRARVHESWGFRARSSRGLGVSVLFFGSSGTGKTMAAEVLANELRLDLFRVDLSQVVSKYIGETEKNLRRVFDAAECGGAILLFDEADALFGKRSEVKDSHDRYANIEVGYLLQRMEAYRGLAILTTNLKGALDEAFLRRLAFVVEFPFPGPEERAQIWRRVFPPATPVESLEVARLARLNLAGGSIRNVAIGAAFVAAEAGEPVRMRHVAAALEREFGKQERSLPDEFRRGG
ncbi:MAG TPA: ATP-binding protein [Polyangiaceae bacterium]|nr:ATP-binding protein [Polyangiaceae bacterium]